MNVMHVALKHLAKQIEVFHGAQQVQMDALCTIIKEELHGVRAHLHAALPVSQRIPWGFGDQTIEANSQFIFEAFGLDTARPYVPTRLLISVAAPGLLVDSFRAGDRELLRGRAVPAELFGDSIGEMHLNERADFGPILRGERVAITLRNPTSQSVRAAVALRGHLETDRERADRFERELQLLRSVRPRMRPAVLDDDSANHDRVCCDCLDCVNWRRAEASHAGVTLPPD